jgi:hypothetical protein
MSREQYVIFPAIGHEATLDIYDKHRALDLSDLSIPRRTFYISSPRDEVAIDGLRDKSPGSRAASNPCGLGRSGLHTGLKVEGKDKCTRS